MFDIAKIEKAIATQEPTLPYEYALWCGEVSRKLAEMAGDYALKAESEIERIATDEIESDQYEVVIPVEGKKSVDLVKLREEQPKIYKNIVHLKATDAVRLIGEEKIYKLAAKSENYSSDLDVVTLSDLKKALGKLAPRYIRTSYHSKARMIVPKGSYHDPRELPEAKE